MYFKINEVFFTKKTISFKFFQFLFDFFRLVKNFFFGIHYRIGQDIQTDRPTDQSMMMMTTINDK